MGTLFSFPPADDWTDFARQAFLRAYSRPVGTLAQDDTRFVEIMTGTVTQTDSAAGTVRSLNVPPPPEPPFEIPQRRLDTATSGRAGERVDS